MEVALTPTVVERFSESEAINSEDYNKGDLNNKEVLGKELFKLWKRSFKNKFLSLEEVVGNNEKRNLEWTAELFNANLFPTKVSISQLRNVFLTSKQNQILATLVPNEIIYTKNPLKNELQLSVGVLLFADVSGFTPLCEKYSNTGKGGTYRLTATLNGYIGAMVEVIYGHGGDVLKFSGDAFLALWKVKKEELMASTIHRVITCAMYIQQALGSFETEVKVCLKVKLAIAAGNLHFSVVGNDSGRHYVCVGTPVDDVKAAEHTCVSGDIVLSPSAWGHCSPLNYEFSYKDEEHVKITQILYDPSSRKRQIIGICRVPAIIIDTDSLPAKEHTGIEDIVGGGGDGNPLGHIADDLKPTKKMEFKRAELQEAARRNLGAVLRQFLIPPVVQQVDADQPLDYLTEMRQVTIAFINIVPAKQQPFHLIPLADTAYSTISRLVRSCSGCVNKMCLFDKDCMVLAVFGLRGFKHELECQQALKCAYQVRRELSELVGITSVSVGVTTGMTYCGVVGHPLRKEYTVIGGVVNKAARMMCSFENKVTADQLTLQLSKLPSNNFILQPPKMLKGLGVINTIYEYTEDKNRLESTDGHTCSLLPFLGHEEELSVSHTMLRELNLSNRQKLALCFSGSPHIGKTRLLEEIKTMALDMDCLPVLISLNAFHSKTSYSLVYMLLKQVLELGEYCSVQDREEKLISISNYIPREKMCYLNDMMQVKFPQSIVYIQDDETCRSGQASDLFQCIIGLCTEKLVFCIDNIHYIDPVSWEILQSLLNTRKVKILVVMTILADEHSSELLGEIKNHKLIVYMELKGLKKQFLAPLACHFLNVRAIPQELNNLLQTRSKGNPGWCESYVTSLMNSGGLITKEMSVSNSTDEFVVPDKRLVFKSLSWNDSEKQTLPEGETFTVCVIPSGLDLHKVLPQNLTAVIMNAFDSLPPYEQLLLKCGSVLGQTFTRTMLIAVMHNPTEQQTAIAVKRLFEMCILNCATNVNYPEQTQHFSFLVPKFVSVPQTLTCICNCIYRPKCFPDWQSLPKYAFCQLMQFKIPVFRDTTYELLPGNQKKDFHARAVAFLENEAHKCDACGGGDFATVPSLLIEAIESQDTIVPSIVADETGMISNISQEVLQNGSSLDNTDKRKKNVRIGEAEESGANLSQGNMSSSSGVKALILNKAAGFIGEAKNPELSVKEEEAMNSDTDYSVWAACFGVPLTYKHMVAMQRYSTFSMGKNFPQADFRNCECPLILAGVYQQLIEHCSAAGLKEKHVQFLIQYGAAAITIGNNLHAIKLLEEALELCSGDVNSQDETRDVSLTKLNLGKIHTLLGQAHLDLSQCSLARFHLIVAMQYFGKPFWSAPMVAAVLLRVHKSRQRLHQMFPNAFLRHSHGKKAVVNDEASACLAHLNNLYMLEKDWKLAKLAAIRSLNLAQKSQNVTEICTAYSNLMDVCHHFGELDYCKKLEEIALKHKYAVREAQDLTALGRLYCAVFSSRSLRGELSSAITVGFRVLQISARVSASHVKLFVLPTLLELLFMATRYTEAIDLDAEMHSLSSEDMDKSIETWHYALCLDLILDSGYCVEMASTCVDFAKKVVTKTEGYCIIRDPDAEKRMVVSTWLWYLRIQQYQEAARWEKLAMQYFDKQLEYTFSSLVTALKLLEGMLITLSTMLSRSQPRNLDPWHSKAYSYIKKIEKMAENIQVIQPRFYHMKAYYCQIYQHKAKAIKYIQKAKNQSILQGNKLQEYWIKHSENHWSGRLNSIDCYFWRENNSMEKNVDWHKCALHNGPSVMYTFETPNNDKHK